MKNDSYICHALYLRNSAACDHDFWYICVKWWFLQEFFSFCEKLDFLSCYLGKKAKMAQNDKKFCLSRFISRKPYIMQLPFIVHLCKMIISRHFFFHIFKILNLIVREAKVQKIVQNSEKKVSLLFSISQEPYIIWFSFMIHKCKMNFKGIVLFFQNFDFTSY